MRVLLAGDIGGTKTLLGLFDPATGRPQAIAVHAFATLDYNDLGTMIAELFERLGGDVVKSAGEVQSACFGIAGPVLGESAALTNAPWTVDGAQVTARFGFARLAIVNDLEAMSWSVPALEASEVHVLQEGVPAPAGNVALIAAGTGLGEALLHHVDRRLVPSPSEGGHADFAARTEREIGLLRDLTRRYGRAEVEHVVSGRGLVNIHRVTHADQCFAGIDRAAAEAPAEISAAALDRRCPGCVEALDLFVEAYGAEAGNLALRAVSTGGLFVGGGIAPKILPALTRGAFMRAFCAKPPLNRLLERMPVKVIRNTEAALLGAAVCAAERLR